MATCNPGCLLNFADIMAAIANDGTATAASTPEPTQPTWDVHIQSSTDSTKYAYFDPDGNKFGVGSISLGDNFTSNTTGWFKFNVTCVTSNPKTVTGQIVTNAISSPNYYLTLTTAPNLEFAPESESGGTRNFTFTFDANGNNFNISGSITPTSGTTPTTYYIAENTSNTLVPQMAEPTDFKCLIKCAPNPGMLLTCVMLGDRRFLGTSENIHLTVVSMKNYAYFQPIKGRIHVADPEKIYLGECFTDNATANFTLVDITTTDTCIRTCRIETHAMKDHYLTMNESEILFASEDEGGGSQVFTFTCSKDHNSFTFSSEVNAFVYFIGVKGGVLIPIKDKEDPSIAAFFLYVPDNRV